MTGVRTLDGEEGAWEQHTRGIGSRLMSKMGHVPGQPLGASARAGASTTKRIFLIFDCAPIGTMHIGHRKSSTQV